MIRTSPLPKSNQIAKAYVVRYCDRASVFGAVDGAAAVAVTVRARSPSLRVVLHIMFDCALKEIQAIRFCFIERFLILPTIVGDSVDGS